MDRIPDLRQQTFPQHLIASSVCATRSGGKTALLIRCLAIHREIRAGRSASLLQLLSDCVTSVGCSVAQLLQSNRFKGEECLYDLLARMQL